MIAKDAVNPSSIDVTFDDIGGKLSCHIFFRNETFGHEISIKIEKKSRRAAGVLKLISISW